MGVVVVAVAWLGVHMGAAIRVHHRLVKVGMGKGTWFKTKKSQGRQLWERDGQLSGGMM